MGELLKNRTFLTQLAALAFALLTMIGVTLPTGFTPDSVVSVALLIYAAVTIVARHLHVGAPEADGKPWWQSRTIWTAILAAIFGVAGLFGLTLPIDQAGALEAIMAVLSLVGAVFAATARAPIGR